MVTGSTAIKPKRSLFRRARVGVVCYSMRRAAVTIALLVTSSVIGVGETAPTDVTGMLSRIADSVIAYYARAQSIICDESVSLQSLSSDLMSDMTPMRRLLYELRVSWEPSLDGSVPEANAVRTLVRVNNRAPREKDHDACMDPRSISPEPLAMFLPQNQNDYIFTAAGYGKVNGQPALMIDYRSRTVGKVSSTRKDDCFSIELPGRTKGRVWIDEETAEILRLDESLTGMVDVTVPPDPKKRGTLPERVTVERLDSTIVYKRVAFTDPDEEVMLPVSKDLVTVVRNAGTPRLRTSATFKNYRRFMTGVRIVQ
jgi:hypothetical protein